MTFRAIGGETMNRTSWLWSIGLPVTLLGLWAAEGRAQAGPPPINSDSLTPAEQAIALVLVGDGAGRVLSASSGLIIRSDGVLLTTYHFVKGAQEVQVRLRNGEVYDQVELLGFDERRDVAALRLPASGLAAFAGAGPEVVKPGDKVRVLAADGSLAWRSVEGVLGPVRLADEFPGAGQGFRVVQFTAPMPPSSLGGALTDSQGRLLGFIPGSPKAAGQPFAIPWQSVAGLPSLGFGRTALGNGKNLTLPHTAPNVEAAAEGPSVPATALARARSLRVTSTTSFFTPFMLEKELMDNAQFRALGVNVVNGFKGGELLVTVERPLFTYDFTYSVSDVQTDIVMATGKVTAIDGPHAAQGIARKLVTELEGARGMQAAPVNSQGTLGMRQ